MSVDFVNRMRKSFRKPSVFTMLYRRAIYLYGWCNGNDDDVYEENLSYARHYHYGHSDALEDVGPNLSIPHSWYYLLCCCFYFDADDLLDSIAEYKLSAEELECYLSWLSAIDSNLDSTFDDMCAECNYVILEDF